MPRFAPMLCTWFTAHKLQFPCYVQPKLNGFRTLCIDGHMFSRGGFQWDDRLLAHILAPIKKAVGPEIILDGELYCHGWSLEQIADAVSVRMKKPTADTEYIAFYVFDLALDAPFEERLVTYRGLVQEIDNAHVQPVPALKADSQEFADALHQLNVQSQFEGSIYRFGETGYECGRSNYLMKRKDVRASGFKEQREFGPRKTVWNARKIASRSSPDSPVLQ